MFIQNASHELLTPLSIIRQKAEKILVNSEKIDQEIASSASDIQQTAVRLSRLSNALLLISRIENKQFPLTDRIDVPELVKEVLAELDDFIRLKNISVNKNFETNEIITGNRELLHSTIFNVVQNAVKFSPESTEVLISFNKGKGEQLKLSVQDHGTGIPDELISSVFDRFKKGKRKENRDIIENGNGLGLSIVKSICDLHDFKCSASNSEDSGAIITIYF
ncbi:MAG: HAMP domain-containing sensor histidine kinase [Balneolaceae bacterium]|nr:HAMP domain-containing sensor histidine kinase [Balneolaceae bacterium]MDR9407851.1 HAMP domain-containing sensor histidine kinase [Balneolaceae bacterium]